MRYELNVDGMTEISNLLGQLEEKAPSVAASALFEGAAVMAEEVKKGAEGIRTAPFKYAKPGERRLPSPEEKQIIVDAGIGIAKFDKNGTEIDTSVGYRNAGYAELAGNQVPIPVIVNSVNSGTSFLIKQPFVRKAARTGETKAIRKMTEHIDNAWNEYIKKMNKL